MYTAKDAQHITQMRSLGFTVLVQFLTQRHIASEYVSACFEYDSRGVHSWSSPRSQTDPRSPSLSAPSPPPPLVLPLLLLLADERWLAPLRVSDGSSSESEMDGSGTCEPLLESM